MNLECGGETGRWPPIERILIYGWTLNIESTFFFLLPLLPKSLVELFQGLLDGEGEGSGSGLSVLRTFRLLRILKLVRFMPNLRRQLVVMLRTMDNVAVFFALLVLFIFIFRYTFHDP